MIDQEHYKTARDYRHRNSDGGFGRLQKAIITDACWQSIQEFKPLRNLEAFRHNADVWNARVYILENRDAWKTYLPSIDYNDAVRKLRLAWRDNPDGARERKKMRETWRITPICAEEEFDA